LIAVCHAQTLGPEIDKTGERQFPHKN